MPKRATRSLLSRTSRLYAPTTQNTTTAPIAVTVPCVVVIGWASAGRSPSAREPGPVALAAQVARWAHAAAVAPLVAVLAVAEIARVRVLDDEVDQRLAAELLGHRPGLCLVEPHQRRVDHHRGVHAEAERDLQRLERVVAAVGIGREVGLAHPADEHRDAASIGDR